MIHKVLRGLLVAWVWFWYNTVTRIFFVLLPTYMVFLIPFFVYVIKVPPNDMANSLSAVYLLIFIIAVYDNDFSKRQKYGIPERVFFKRKVKS
jgi:hypothetical protein